MCKEKCERWIKDCCEKWIKDCTHDDCTAKHMLVGFVACPSCWANATEEKPRPYYVKHKEGE